MSISSSWVSYSESFSFAHMVCFKKIISYYLWENFSKKRKALMLHIFKCQQKFHLSFYEINQTVLCMKKIILKKDER